MPKCMEDTSKTKHEIERFPVIGLNEIKIEYHDDLEDSIHKDNVGNLFLIHSPATDLDEKI